MEPLKLIFKINKRGMLPTYPLSFLFPLLLMFFFYVYLTFVNCCPTNTVLQLARHLVSTPIQLSSLCNIKKKVYHRRKTTEEEEDIILAAHGEHSIVRVPLTDIVVIVLLNEYTQQQRG